jgi:hypothetical protein
VDLKELESRKQKAEGRKLKAEGRKLKAEGRKLKAEGTSYSKKSERTRLNAKERLTAFLLVHLACTALG